jgi:hypothetical protein
MHSTRLRKELSAAGAHSHRLECEREAAPLPVMVRIKRQPAISTGVDYCMGKKSTKH